MERLPTYEQLYTSFRWNIPARYNIAADVCDRHAADPNKVALIGEGAGGETWRMTFREIQRRANQLANLLVSLGLVKGDRSHVVARPKSVDCDRACRLLESQLRVGSRIHVICR